MDQLDNGKFIKDVIYNMNLPIDGTYYPVQLQFLGITEMQGTTEIGHFMNVKTGTLWKLEKEKAMTMLPQPELAVDAF